MSLTRASLPVFLQLAAVRAVRQAPCGQGRQHGQPSRRALLLLLPCCSLQPCTRRLCQFSACPQMCIYAYVCIACSRAVHAGPTTTLAPYLVPTRQHCPSADRDTPAPSWPPTCRRIGAVRLPADLSRCGGKPAMPPSAVLCRRPAALDDVHHDRNLLRRRLVIPQGRRLPSPVSSSLPTSFPVHLHPSVCTCLPTCFIILSRHSITPCLLPSSVSQTYCISLAALPPSTA